MNERIKVLIIDESQDFIKILEHNLLTRNCAVSSASNGQKGLLMIQEIKPDIVILDQDLSDHNGWDLIKIIKNTPETKNILTILRYSIQDISANENEISERVADGQFSKNISVEKLAADLDIFIQKKQVEKVLETSESRYRGLITNLEAGIVVHAKDTSVLSCNGLASKLLGLSLDQMLGKEAIDPYWRFVYEDKSPLPLDEYPVIRIIKSRKPIKNQILGVWLPDRGITWLMVNGFPTMEESGEIAEIIISFIDITERKQTEEALKQSQERLEFVIEGSQLGYWDWNIEAGTVYRNPRWAEMLGFTLQEIEFNVEQWSDLQHPDDRELAWKSISDHLEGHTPVHKVEYRMRTKDGQYKWILDQARIVERDAQGKPMRMSGTHTDITERKQAERVIFKAKEKAEESDRLKSAFLANMSHEIRTPMNGILGFADLLNKPDLSGEQQQKYISIIEKSGQRMLNIINDIVDISKIEAGLMQKSNSLSNINEQIEYIHSFFKQEAEAKGLTFRIRNTLETNEVIVVTDREKLYAILTNLVKNAIKYTDKGEIELGCSHRDGFIEFYVKDTGIGIPKARQEAIFERFIQAEIEDKMARQGAGLGLAISKAYVEMLGGKLWVESEVEKGSVFHFTLPFHVNIEDSISNHPEQFVEEYGNVGSQLTILIVEDDSTSAMLLETALEKMGNKTATVGNGLKAVEYLHQNPETNLVLMDISLPEMNGLEATRKIRSFNKDIIIIAQTAFGFSVDKEKSLEAGCNDYVAKPIKFNVLQSLINKYFEK
jgi:PAS domain S-box-containing protein